MNLGPYCVYCLAAVRRNTQSCIEVQPSYKAPLEAYTGSRQPRRLGDWLARNEAESPDGQAIFLLDGMFGAFQIATTWHGDPVCEIHMVELVRS